MNCKKCGQEVDKKAVVCTGCGCKIKKPIYKRWWVWVVAFIVIVAVGSSGGNETQQGNEASQAVDETIVYEQADLAAMIDDLKNNAMKAENNYQNKNIEITVKIKNFDSLDILPQNLINVNTFLKFILLNLTFFLNLHYCYTL